MPDPKLGQSSEGDLGHSMLFLIVRHRVSTRHGLLTRFDSLSFRIVALHMLAYRTATSYGLLSTNGRLDPPSGDRPLSALTAADVSSPAAEFKASGRHEGGMRDILY